MTDPAFPYEPPHVRAEPSKKSPRRLWLVGCGGVLLCLLLAVGTCALLVKGGMAAGEREFAPACERYLSAVAAGNYHGAYAEFGRAMRATTSEEDYVSLDQGIHARIGKLRSKTVQSVQAGAGKGGRWGRILYQCQFEKGPGTLRMELRQEDGEWKVVGFNYDSSLLDEAMRALLRKQVNDAGPTRSSLQDELP
jgi:hypothetical protein